jgi:hypothetical protein
MRLLEVKKVKIGEKEFPIKITNRAMIEYEKLSGGSVSAMEGTEDLCQLFYCTAKAGAKSELVEFGYSYEEFLDLIDDYYNDTMINFSKALVEPGGEGKKE